jgi:hypothetical protein
MPLNLDFTTVLASLGPEAAFRVANAARPPADYLFATLLPERNVIDYAIKSGTMTVRATMAGLAALDSPYPPGGLIEASTFLAEAAKIANEVEMNEYSIRQLQQLFMQLSLSGTPTNETLQNEVLNFLDKVIIQAHLDTMEYLRSRALVFGAIDWTFNKLNLAVDYGVPAANFLAERSGTASWDSTASAFWADIRLLRQVLNYDVRAFIAHPDTINAIVSNDVNKAEIFGQNGLNLSLRRLIGDNERPSTDVRDTVSLISYGNEAEILDPANPGETIKIPFMPRGRILAVGNAQLTGYRVGMGSAVEDPTLTGVLGYTHLAPTVEGGGRAGRWAELYVPQGRPMKLNGRGVTNGLPVIEAANRIAVASSDLATAGVSV